MKQIEGYFEGRKKFKLFYRAWLPDGKVKAILLIAHGVAEHCGRYNELAEYFANKDYGVYGFDYRGHGKSEGRRGYVEHISYYLDDLHIFYQMVIQQNPYKKIFLYGHSMGAIVGLAAAFHKKYELVGDPSDSSQFAGLILSGTALKVKPDLPAAILTLLKPLALLAPHLGLQKIDSSTLSRDKKVIESYDSDPLVYRGKLSARLAVDLVCLIHDLRNQVSKIKTPVLILHGADDRLSYPEGASLLMERIGSPDKTLKIYAGFYHEILNEPGHNRVISDMEAWLSGHSL
jgi:acylglycerol lipase